ncbi:MAG TPA: helix-turn-helix transcriptional regulator [Noviherbaspirillum sp.]|uniref:helix-turn-helix domain-containing protein n=1 Tax=Noviherbaspirillum sp. TaxID=1926288 RepID=UPI002B4698D9|nr:helix-turn-helix transcriptional regulator [Noviherbaspirillum sp.]HJV84315.1 helix-turn-helix transcriptional regulator [Noviherbaspirillum sp.]
MTLENQGEISLENVKVAVALRAARTALGWNQQEFAEKLGVAKSTVARIETADSVASAPVLMKALGLLATAGVEVDLLGTSGLRFAVTAAALQEAKGRLQDDQMRRADRKRGK